MTKLIYDDEKKEKVEKEVLFMSWCTVLEEGGSITMFFLVVVLSFISLGKALNLDKK